MENTLRSRFKRGWNAFLNRDPTTYYNSYGQGYTIRPDRPRLSRGNERSIITAIFNRIAVDCAQTTLLHCRTDEDGRYVETIKSNFNKCLTLEANLDQTGRAFIHDAVLSMLDEGVVALLPIDTDTDLDETGSFNIMSMRTGKILEWFPDKIRAQAYNELDGRRDELIFHKRNAAIVENPFYTVMNESNSTLKRLLRKIALLDHIDEQNGSGKLDMIIQLPYTTRTELRKQQAEDRKNSIRDQLKDPLGIAYIDGTEKVIQLNRPVDNNLLPQIEHLMDQLYSQLNITQSILDGTADEATMLNYYNRTIEPIVAAFADEMKRKFLTKTARSQGQSIMWFRDPFKLVPAAQLAEIADKMTRNEIMTKNEFRPIIGLKPSNDPKADMLINSNINQSHNEVAPKQVTKESEEGGTGQNGKV